MAKRKKPATDTEILDALRENKGIASRAASALKIKAVTVQRRLSLQPLKDKHRALVLRMAKGNVAVAAANLGISREYLHREIKKKPELEESVYYGREARIDLFESALDKNVQAGKEASIIFGLKTLGKERGYIERQEITGKDGAPILEKVKVTYVQPRKTKPRSRKTKSKR